MLLHRFATALIPFVAIASAAAAADAGAAAARGSVRESRNVTVGERQETWQLRWTGARKAVCAPADPAAYTCPCDVFAYAEEGELALVRSEGDKEIDRLALAAFFDDSESPRSRAGVAVLRWRPREQGDRADDAALPNDVAKRAPSAIMKFADYRADGSAHAFVLPTESGPCGHAAGVLVGLSGDPPKLRAFGSEQHPDRPLQLPLSVWRSLLIPAPIHRVTVWTCGDHGSDTETEIEIAPSAHGFRVLEREFGCSDDGVRGALRSESER